MNVVQTRTLGVAGVQLECRNGEVEANLAHAERFVARARDRGAQLILCPEFLAAGYVYDPSLWQAAEPQGGPTERWLRRMAIEHRVHIGASYLEVSGDDFFNTFALLQPNGAVAGRVRKESLPGFEGWYFSSCPGSKVIETRIGRIGVGICYDNYTARFLGQLRSEDADLLLMPHSGPCIGLSWFDALFRDSLREIARFYSRAFGIPTVMVNKASVTDSSSPIPVLPFVRLPFHFPGFSTICDSDGGVRDALGEGEGIVAAEVVLDPSRKRRPEEPVGHWSRPPKQLPRVAGAVFQAFELLARAAYAISPARRRAARSAAARAVRPVGPHDFAPTAAARHGGVSPGRRG
jgi:N-carbamoylputrescine amidase